jgi:hypothetical protein
MKEQAETKLSTAKVRRERWARRRASAMAAALRLAVRARHSQAWAAPRRPDDFHRHARRIIDYARLHPHAADHSQTPV